VTVVVDASVVVDWVAPGASLTSPAHQLLAGLSERDEEIVVPRLLREEVGNALLTGLRRGRWRGAEADRAFGFLASLPITTVDDARDLQRAWDLSRRYDDHPIYDMLYVALAQRTRTVLVTADDALRERLGAPAWIVGPEAYVG
jgi:predicted nucleic acid-binding protein